MSSGKRFCTNRPCSSETVNCSLTSGTVRRIVYPGAMDRLTLLIAGTLTGDRCGTAAMRFPAYSPGEANELEEPVITVGLSNPPEAHSPIAAMVAALKANTNP